MTLLARAAALLISFTVGIDSVYAQQQCSQTLPMAQRADHVQCGSGIAVFSFLDRAPGGEGEIDIYEKSPASGVFELQQTLPIHHSAPGGTESGISSATDGQTIVVISDNIVDQNTASIASVFEKNVHLGSWELTAEFTPPPSAASNKFYGGLAVDGDRIYLGAPLNGGIVHELIRDPLTGVWSYGQSIPPPPTAGNGYFGVGLDLVGGTLAIGCISTNGYRGSVEMYEYSVAAGQWQHQQSISPNGLPSWAYFGGVLDLDGDRMIVGASGYDVGQVLYAGAAFIFQRNPATNIWSLSKSIINTAATPTWEFAGATVALEGDHAYISVPGDFNPAGLRRGSIWPYTYSPQTGSWIPQSIFFTQVQAGSSTWSPIGMSGIGSLNGVLVFSGTHQTNPSLHFRGLDGRDCDGNGVTDLCEIDSAPGLDLNGNAQLDACEGIGVPYCRPTTPNSSGLLSGLFVDGSQLVQENNITVRARDLPLNQFGYALNSPYQGVIPNVAGSQGNLCIFGPSLGRHNRPGEVRYSGANGRFDLTVDLNSFPSPLGAIVVQAGETWNFQVWHRDQNPTSTSNLTNAVSVTFQ